jgi:hypothetical protein
MARLEATYEFGDVRVDAASELVSRSSTPVPLEPKAFQLLVYFIQHRGRLLDKQEILDAVLGGRPHDPDAAVLSPAATSPPGPIRATKSRLSTQRRHQPLCCLGDEDWTGARANAAGDTPQLFFGF